MNNPTTVQYHFSLTEMVELLRELGCEIDKDPLLAGGRIDFNEVAVNAYTFDVQTTVMPLGTSPIHKWVSIKAHTAKLKELKSIAEKYYKSLEA